MWSVAPYKVVVVEDSELPHDHPWAFVEFEGRVRLLVKASEFTPETMSQAWATLRAIEQRPAMPTLRLVNVAG